MLGARFCQVGMEGTESAHFLFPSGFSRIEPGFGFIGGKKNSPFH